MSKRLLVLAVGLLTTAMFYPPLSDDPVTGEGAVEARIAVATVGFDGGLQSHVVLLVDELDGADGTVDHLFRLQARHGDFDPVSISPTEADVTWGPDGVTVSRDGSVLLHMAVSDEVEGGIGDDGSYYGFGLGHSNGLKTSFPTSGLTPEFMEALQRALNSCGGFSTSDCQSGGMGARTCSVGGCEGDEDWSSCNVTCLGSSFACCGCFIGHSPQHACCGCSYVE